MRRKSSRPDHRSPHSDFLDDLDNDSRPSRNEPTPPVRVTALKRPVEDRRRWAPGPDRVPRDFSGRIARVSHQPKKSPLVLRGPGGKPLQSRLSVQKVLEHASPRFAEARKAVICFKRKVRREVLHALKLKRSGRGGRKRRNEWSDVQC